MKTEQGNRLIAEFMGLREDLPNRWYNPFTFPHEWFHSLKYDSSFGWLMPVWNKIMSLGKDRYGVYWVQELTQDGLKITIAHREGELLIVDLFYREEYIQIEKVWNAVVKFVEWNNKNKSK